MSSRSSDAPDYASYDLNELREARRSIDDVAHPERAARIDALIVEREATAEPEPAFRLNAKYVATLTATIHIVGGLVGLVGVAIAFGRTGSIQAVTTFFGLFCLGSVGVGIALWARQPWARPAIFTLLVLQIPAIVTPLIAYKLFLVASITPYFSSRFTVGWNAGFGSVFRFVLNPEVDVSTIGFNAIPCMLAIALWLAREDEIEREEQELPEVFT